MKSHINLSIKPQTPCTIIPCKKPISSIPYSSLTQCNYKTHKTLALASSSPTQENPISTTTTTTTTKEAKKLKKLIPDDSYNVEFKTMGGCKLGISRYPDFEYNANGGSGVGSGLDGSNGEILVNFDVGKLYIPPLTSETTKFLGLPLPPFLRIDIVPENFQGSIDKNSGKVDLEFKAKFWFSMGTIYKAPALVVVTVLTTEESKGKLRKGRGERMDKDGKCKLVGVATVDPIDDAFMNTFLSLPTECLAILNASISL